MTTPNSKNAERLARVAASLKKRHAAEKRFRFFGVLASLLALSFVAIFFVSILSRGLPAFWQATFNLDVYFDPAIIEVEPRPVPNPGESPADFQQRDYAWQSQVGMVNWNRILENSLIALRPDLEDERRTLRSLFTSGERFALRDRFIENPDLLGQTVRLKLLADANVDVWIRGNIDRDLPDAQQQLSPRVRELADAFFATDALQMNFSTALLVNPDSRSSPASAGLGGAFMGSVYMILVVLFLSVPLAVAAAIYLEEFAPRNAITDLIEVNINNLAAVPSIVFGLLGAAVFINYLKMPLSAPLVGGLVLSLMTLPTVIIATRAALKAVPHA